MGPAAFMTNADNPIFTIADWADDIGILYHLFGFYEFLPHYDFITQIGHIFCDIAGNEPQAGLCENIVFIFPGINEAQLNMKVNHPFKFPLKSQSTGRIEAADLRLYQ